MCDHDYVLVSFGGLRLIAGDVVDDTTEQVICRKCGQPQPEPMPVDYSNEPDPAF